MYFQELFSLVNFTEPEKIVPVVNLYCERTFKERK
jgi:hypothetical protein